MGMDLQALNGLLLAQLRILMNFSIYAISPERREPLKQISTHRDQMFRREWRADFRSYLKGGREG